jgi:4-hydroxybenzoyl-CoA thioesterase
VPPFRRAYPIRFGDIDHAGIAFYPSLLRLVHEAFEDAWAEGLGRPYAEVCDGAHLGFPAVHLDADFAAPLRFGERVEIAVSVPRVGTRSVTWRYALTRSDGVAAARLDVTTATVDLRTFAGCPVPDWCRTLLGRLAPE